MHGTAGTRRKALAERHPSSASEVGIAATDLSYFRFAFLAALSTHSSYGVRSG